MFHHEYHDRAYEDISYGKNGYYCSTMTQAGEYIQLFIQSVEVFQNTPTFRPFLPYGISFMLLSVGINFMMMKQFY